MANSAALGGATTDISDLNAVVNRLGRELVKSSAMAYAMKQMREAQKLEAAQPYLESLWAESTHLAALCYVLARKPTKLNADQALLVGLLHGIGKLYILVQAEAQPSLFQSKTIVDEVLESWHAAIGSAILEAWKFPEEVSSSVAKYREIAREHDGPTDLTDILIVAYLISRWICDESDGELQLNEVPAVKHLAVTAADIGEILSGAEEQIAALRAALGK